MHVKIPTVSLEGKSDLYLSLIGTKTRFKEVNIRFTILKDQVTLHEMQDRNVVSAEFLPPHATGHKKGEERGGRSIEERERRGKKGGKEREE